MKGIEILENLLVIQAAPEQLAAAVLAQADKVIAAREVAEEADRTLRTEKRTLEIMFDELDQDARAALRTDPNHWADVYGNLPNDLSASEH